MLISRSRKLLFVHIQKTGGSSVARVLEKSVPDLEPFKAKHAFLSAGYGDLPDWDGYFKFAFVRNPWDRLVSWYSMIDQARDIRWYQALLDARSRKHYRQFRANPLWRYALEQGRDFPGFLRHCHLPVEVGPGVRYSFAYNQVDYLNDDNGRRLVDFVGRFENWEEDARAVFDRLGIKVHSWPRRNPSRHRHYSAYYNEQTAAVVRERFARDIAAFGYEFADHG